MSKLQDIVGGALKTWFYEYQIYVNTRPPFLHGMELDFYIPALKLAVEVQGRQHKLFCQSMQGSVDDHIAQRSRDIRKRQLCGQEGIHLVCVDERDSRLLWGLQHKFRRHFKDQHFNLGVPNLEMWVASDGSTMIVNERSRMSEWISVKDRLPCQAPGGELVLAFETGLQEILLARFTSNQWCKWITGKPINVSHWMPLPDPPPKPDAFEEWWMSHRGTLNGDNEREISGSSTPKDVARTIWYAAVAATRKEQ